MAFSDKYKKLGEIVVQKLRDENYEYYLKIKEHTKSMTAEEYLELSQNRYLAPDLQEVRDERFKFFNSLTDEQLGVLDRLILHILDSTTFNFLREAEEDIGEEKSIGLTIGGEKAVSITPEFLSGTFFGEYFLWIERNSRYGRFQY